jgi:hypothetical protein
VSPRLRNTLSAVLTALACLLAPCGTLAAWAVHGPADTSRYVAATAPLAADPAVREAVADALGDGIMNEAGAGSLPSAVRPYVREAARSFTRTEAYRAGWEAANRAVHDAVLRALRDEGAAGRPVTVDLAPAVARVRSRLLSDNVPLARHIPVRDTEVTVVSAREADRLREGYHVLDVAAFWLPLAAVVFAVAGIAVAACRRRALMATGIGTALGGALLVLAVLAGRRLTLAGLPGAVDDPAAGAVYDALTATLRTASWLLVALGATITAATWLARRHGPLPRSLFRRRPPAEATADTTDA